MDGCQSREVGHDGELSSARQALESTGVAPGDQNTLNALRSPEWRLRAPRAPLPPDLRAMVPDGKFELDEECFCRNLRSARRGTRQALQA